MTSDRSIIASIPYFRARPYIRRAVESLLAQTCREISVVVVNDGDPDPPWPELAHIRDTRLIRFDLARNHGPYFAHQVVLGASTTPYFLVQDADDWSAPERVSTLLDALVRQGADLAFSAWQQYRPDDKGVLCKDSIRWRRKQPDSLTAPVKQRHGPLDNKPPHEPFLFDTRLTAEFINRASHHGLFRRQALKNLGGYFAGFRINHDTLLTNLLMMTGKVAFVEAPLYHYLLHRDSLSHHPSSGARSAARIMARAQQESIYREALSLHHNWAAAKLVSSEFIARIRQLASRHVTPEDRRALQTECARLRHLLQGSA